MQYIGIDRPVVVRHLDLLSTIPERKDENRLDTLIVTSLLYVDEKAEKNAVKKEGNLCVGCINQWQWHANKKMFSKY